MPTATLPRTPEVAAMLRKAQLAGDDIDRQVAAETECVRCRCVGLRLVFRNEDGELVKYTRCPNCGRMEVL